MEPSRQPPPQFHPHPPPPDKDFLAFVSELFYSASSIFHHSYFRIIATKAQRHEDTQKNI